MFAESHYGGGDLARYAAAKLGMHTVPGQAVNRHCAGSLTAVASGARALTTLLYELNRRGAVVIEV